MRIRRSELPILCLSALLAGPACGPDMLLPHEEDEHAHIEARPVDDGSNILMQGIIDCTTHADTGYRQGDAFEITVVTVDGKPAEIATANAYYVMQQAAARDGVSLRIVSGFRTMSQQQYFYNCYVNCNCNNCNLAARPGYSNHQSGHALDLNTSTGGVYAWLERHGASFGFERTVPSEDWHWEWWGGGPGGGPCGSSGGGTTTGRRVVGVTYDASQGSSARIAGATVKLMQNGTEVGSATSNATGFFAFDVQSGTYTIVATAGGFQRATREVSASATGDNWGSVGLMPAAAAATGIYRGVVYAGANPGDQPIAGATVRLSSGQSATTSGTGAFSFELPPGEITATAQMTGYAGASVTRTVVAGQTVWGSIRIIAATEPAPPDALLPPTPISPVDGALADGANVVLTWSRVTHAQYTDIAYGIEVRAQGSTTPLLTLAAGQPPSGDVTKQLPSALVAGVYAWRVKTFAGSVHSPWSPQASFVVEEVPFEGPASSSSSGGGTSSSTPNPPESSTSSSSSSGSVSDAWPDEGRPDGGEAAPATPPEEAPATGCTHGNTPVDGTVPALGFALALYASRTRRRR